VRDERLEYLPIVHDELIVAMRPEHSLADRKSVHLADLAGQPLVTREYGSATRGTLERALGEAGHSFGDLNVILELGSAEAIKMAIRSTDAVAVLSEWSVRDEARLGLLKTVPLKGGGLGRDLYLIWRAHGFLSVASEAFVQFLREVYLAEK
jgi:DNA-binding transcriptional LysR family regulator